MKLAAHCRQEERVCLVDELFPSFWLLQNKCVLGVFYSHDLTMGPFRHTSFNWLKVNDFILVAPKGDAGKGRGGQFRKTQAFVEALQKPFHTGTTHLQARFCVSLSDPIAITVGI